MYNDLDKLYEALKNGHSGGVNLSAVFENEDANYLRKVQNRAINEGFADTPAITYYPQIVLKLTNEGKQYQTFKDYCERHKKTEMNISNSILGNNNAENTVGQDFSVLPTSQPTNEPNQKLNKKPKTQVEMSIAQFIFWLLSAVIFGITIGYNVFSTLKK